MAEPSPPSPPGRRVLRILRWVVRATSWTLAILALLLALVGVALYLPPVQALLRDKAVTFVEERTGADVHLGLISLRFPIGLTIRDLSVADPAGDTLLQAGLIRTRLSVTGLLGQEIVLTGVRLEDLDAHLVQHADSSFNFDFLVDGLAGSDTVATPPADTTGGWGFRVHDLTLRNIRYRMAMAPAGLELDTRLGELRLDLEDMDLDASRYRVGDLLVRGAQIRMSAPSGVPEPDTYPDLVNPVADIDIGFEELDLQDVSFVMRTTGTPDSLWLGAEELLVEADEVLLPEQRVWLDAVQLRGARFGMLVSDTTASTDTTRTEPPWLDRHDGFRYFARDWDFRINDLEVSDASLALHTGTVADPAVFPDAGHLVLKDILLDAEELAFSNTNIALRVNEAELLTPPDSQATGTSFTLNATPHAVAVKDLRLEAMGARATLDLELPRFDLSRTYREPERVEVLLALQAGMERRRLMQLSGADTVAASNEMVTLVLDAEGSLDSLHTLRVKLDDAGAAHLDLAAQGANLLACPDCRMELDVDSLSFTNAPGSLVRRLAGGAPLPEWLRGTLRGKLDNGRADLELALASDQGAIRGTLAGSGLEDARPDGYAADLELLDIDLAGLTGDTLLAPLSARISGEGHALPAYDRRAWLQIDRLEGPDEGDEESTVCLLAEVFGDSLFADAEVISHPLVLDLKARSQLPDGDPMHAVFDLALQRADLGELQLMDSDLLVRGDWHGHLVLDTTGHGTLDLEAEGLQLADAERKFAFEHFRLHGLYGADSLAVDLDSDALTLAFLTNTALDSLADRINGKLVSYLRPDLAFEPDPDAVLRLDATLPRPELLTGLLLPGLKAIELNELHLDYDGSTDALEARITVPVLMVDSIDVTGLALLADGAGGDLRASLSTDRVEQGSWYVPGLALEVAPEADWLHLVLAVGGPDSTTHRLGARTQARSDTLVVRLDDEQLLAASRWQADKDNLLRLAPELVQADAFGIRQGERTIRFVTEAGDEVLEFAGFPLEALASLVTSTDSTELASGDLYGEVRWSEVLPEADVRVDGLQVLGADIGDLEALVERKGATRVHAEAKLRRGVNRMDVLSDMDLGDTPSFAAQADIGFADLSFLQPLLQDLLFDLDGGISGRVDVDQRGGKLHAEGDLAFDRTRFGVVQTGAMYQVPDGRLLLDGRNVHLDGFRVLDSLGQALVLDGSLFFADLADPTMDLRVRTDRFRAVHSTAKQNDVFYGDLFGRLDLTAKGPLAHPALKGDVSVLPGTHFSVVLPGSEVELIESDGVVVFTEDLFAVDTLSSGGHAALVRDSILASLPGVDLDVQLHVDQAAEFFIVLDPASGDEASVRGQGDLSFRYDAEGKMDLHGTFEVLEGGYTLEFYGLVHKRFDLVKGSSITWSGDPVKAEMDLTALYRSITAPYSLVSGGESLPEEEQNRLKKPLPFDVLIHFTGRLDDPALNFELDLDEQLRRKFPMVDSRLESLAQPGNKEELDRQVFGLLVLNSFIQENGAETVAASDLATTAARNSMNGLLTDQLNKLTGKFLKGVDISVGMYTYDQSSGGRTYQRTSLDYKVSKRLINDRLTFEVGGALDMDDGSDRVSNVSNTRAAEYALLYDVTPDGRFQLRGFHENSYDLYDGEITRSGVAFMFTRDYLTPARQAAHDAAEPGEEDPRNDERPADGRREDE